jgi:hypothetical protein
MTTTKTSKAQLARDEQAAAIEQCRIRYPAGSTVSTVLTHTSSSGMLRTFRVVLGHSDGTVSDATHMVARAGGFKLHRNGDIAMGGCGMDMGFALAYSLSRTLYADGFECTGVVWGGRDGTQRCPSNDHVNERGPGDFTPGRLHSDPGYALNHRHV